MKFESPGWESLVTVSYTNVTAPVGGDTYIVQYCSSSPVGGDANIMTAWMTVKRTARTTWFVTGLASRYSTINILVGRCSTS